MTVLWLATVGARGRLICPSLLAQERAPSGGPSPLLDPRALWWQYIILLGVVLALLLAVYLLARWRKSAGASRPSASDQLSDFRTLYDQGQISREEFERLRSMLGERMRREMEGLPAPERRPAPGSSPPSPRPPAPGPPPD